MQKLLEDIVKSMFSDGSSMNKLEPLFVDKVKLFSKSDRVEAEQ